MRIFVIGLIVLLLIGFASAQPTESDGGRGTDGGGGGSSTTLGEFTPRHETDSRCIDTDSGRNYFEQGVVVIDDASKTDYCSSSTLLIEYYCEDNNIKEETYDCFINEGTKCDIDENSTDKGKCLSNEYEDIVNSLENALNKPFAEQNDAISKIFAGVDPSNFVDVLNKIETRFNSDDLDRIKGIAGKVYEKNIAMEQILENLWYSESRNLITGKDNIVYRHILRDLLEKKFDNPGNYDDINGFSVGFDIEEELQTILSDPSRTLPDPFKQHKPSTSWEDIIINRALDDFVPEAELQLSMLSNFRTPEQVAYDEAEKRFAEDHPNLDIAAEIGMLPIPFLEAIPDIKDLKLAYDSDQLTIKGAAYHTVMIAMSAFAAVGAVKKVGSLAERIRTFARIEDIGELSGSSKYFFGAAARLSDEAIESVARIARSSAPRKTRIMSLISYFSRTAPKGAAETATTISNIRKSPSYELAVEAIRDSAEYRRVGAKIPTAGGFMVLDHGRRDLLIATKGSDISVSTQGYLESVIIEYKVIGYKNREAILAVSDIRLTKIKQGKKVNKLLIDAQAQLDSGLQYYKMALDTVRNLEKIK